MHTLEVGRPYVEDQTSHPQRDLLRLTPSFCELTRFMSSPTAQELAAHNAGAATFALINESPDVFVLAYNYGDFGWCDAPYQAHRALTDRLGAPTATDNGSLDFTTILVDADTGIIRSLRVDNWPAAFANTVRDLITEQLAHPFDHEAAAQKLNALYAQYPTSQAMAEARAIAAYQSATPAAGGNAPLTITYY